jgi:hypothetical protein
MKHKLEIELSGNQVKSLLFNSCSLVSLRDNVRWG